MSETSFGVDEIFTAATRPLRGAGAPRRAKLPLIYPNRITEKSGRREKPKLSHGAHVRKVGCGKGFVAEFTARYD